MRWIWFLVSIIIALVFWLFYNQSDVSVSEKDSIKQPLSSSPERRGRQKPYPTQSEEVKVLTAPEYELSVTPDVSTQPEKSAKKKVPLDIIPNLDKVEDRQRYYNELVTFSPIVLWSLLSELENTDNYRARYMIEDALATKLQNNTKDKLTHSDDKALYPLIEEKLHSSGSPESQTPLIDLLGRIATPNAMQILLDNVTSVSPGSDIHIAFLDSIKKATSVRWHGRFHPELSPSLEAFWQSYGVDEQTSITVGNSIARVGSPSGIKLLLDEIGAVNSMDDLQHNPRAMIAFLSMKHVRNPDVVTTLQAGIMSYENMSAPVYLAKGEALSLMNTPEATQVMIDWAKNAPNDTSALANQWFSQANDTASISLMRESANGDGEFSSQQVKQALTDALAKIDQSLTDDSGAPVRSPHTSTTEIFEEIEN
ncbi:MAG: hypothetical protein GY862_10395 [Gammaproteobacteria bacterium]|nr:hypothetical protein [Gammaproteobacteria bacterium]